jgi:hypothetical protein
MRIHYKGSHGRPDLLRSAIVRLQCSRLRMPGPAARLAAHFRCRLLRQLQEQQFAAYHDRTHFLQVKMCFLFHLTFIKIILS